MDVVIFCSRHEYETNIYRHLMTKCFPDMEFNACAAKDSKSYLLSILAKVSLAGMCYVAPAADRHKSDGKLADAEGLSKRGASAGPLFSA